jgi:hypothetical protein
MLFPILESIEMVAYRGLRALKLEKLGQVSLIFGPNNSGKTSILEAISLFCQPLDLRQWLSVVRQRDPGRIGESRVISLRWCFPQSQAAIFPEEGKDEVLFRGEVEIRGDGVFSAKQLNVTYNEIYGEMSADERNRHSRLNRPRGSGDYAPAFRYGAELTAHVRTVPGDRIDAEVFTIWENEPAYITSTPRPPRMPVKLVTSASYHAGQQLVQLVHRIRSGARKTLAVDVLRRFDPAVEDVEISSSRGARGVSP